MPLLAPVMTATLPLSSLPIRPVMLSLPPSAPRRCYALGRGIVTALGWGRLNSIEMIPALQVLGTVALGATAGMLGGLFGIGGGVLAIPLLGIAFGLSQQAAQGTTLLMVVPNVLFGFWQYRRRFGVDL